MAVPASVDFIHVLNVIWSVTVVIPVLKWSSAPSQSKYLEIESLAYVTPLSPNK
jgi:hypothetical protein